MKKNLINELLGRTDIYLLDQIMKGTYHDSEVILDAGCGSGRNLHWFYKNNFSVYGLDINKAIIEEVKKIYANQASNFSVSKIEKINFKDNFFDHLICIAVLHFAENELQFFNMFKELMRVLKPNGTIFIRVASDIGISNKVKYISEGVYKLPDGTTRFLLTKTILNKLIDTYNIKLLEPLKTVNVNNLRCMSTLVIQKN